MAQEVQSIMKKISLQKVVLNMGVGKSGDALCLLLVLILNPGLESDSETSRPKIPICGSYFTPGISICSLIPKE